MSAIRAFVGNRYLFVTFARRLHSCPCTRTTTRLSIPVVKNSGQLYVSTGLLTSISRRSFTTHTTATSRKSRRNATVVIYTLAAITGVAGMSYAAVPLYRLYCQVSMSAYRCDGARDN